MRQAIEGSDMDGSQRRGVGIRRRPGLELRHFYDRVDRTIHDRLRERQHVRGEAHPLLRNSSFEESSSVNATISSNTNEDPTSSLSTLSIHNYCSICGQLSALLDAHLTTNHPGCGLLTPSGVCGLFVDAAYILCYRCKKKYTSNAQDDIYLHTLAPDIIYNEDDLTEIDVNLTMKLDVLDCDKIDIVQLLGSDKKIEGIPMEK